MKWTSGIVGMWSRRWKWSSQQYQLSYVHEHRKYWLHVNN